MCVVGVRVWQPDGWGFGFVLWAPKRLVEAPAGSLDTALLFVSRLPGVVGCECSASLGSASHSGVSRFCGGVW